MAGKRGRGQPTKIDQILRHDDDGQPITVAEQVVAAICAGNYVEQAAAAAGVSKVAVYDWLKQGARISTDISQGRRTVPRTGTQERKVLEFSYAVGRAEAEWEVAAIATLERLGQPRTVTEIRVTTENGAVVKTVTLTRTEEADAATIRWRLERRFPSRYGRHQAPVSDPAGVAVPPSIREQAAKTLSAAAQRLAESVALARAPSER